MEKNWRESALSWVGRKVRIVEGPSTENGSQEVGTVICVDATDYRPSAWVKVGGIGDTKGRPSYPSYRSCDLCWLETEDGEDSGPAWASPPDTKGHAEQDALVIAERIRCIPPENQHG